MEEAARVEGATSLAIYWYIMLPLVRPALATVGLINFLGAWNGLFYLASRQFVRGLTSGAVRA